MWTGADRRDRVHRWVEAPMGPRKLVGRAMIMKGTIMVSYNESHRERVAMARAKQGLSMDGPNEWPYHWRIPCR